MRVQRIDPDFLKRRDLLVVFFEFASTLSSSEPDPVSGSVGRAGKVRRDARRAASKAQATKRQGWDRRGSQARRARFGGPARLTFVNYANCVSKD